MKTLLLTTAAALTLAITASAARAEHHHHHQNGQDAVAFGSGSGFGYRPASYGYGNSYGNSLGYNGSQGYQQFTPGVTPLNNGWSVGSFNPGWSGNYGGYNGGLTAGSGYYRPSGSNCGNSGFTGNVPAILPGGCYSNGPSVGCSQNSRYRLHQSYGQPGYGQSGYGLTGFGLR